MTPSSLHTAQPSVAWQAPHATMRTTQRLDRQFLNAIRVKPDCLPSVPAAVVARLKLEGLL